VVQSTQEFSPIRGRRRPQNQRYSPIVLGNYNSAPLNKLDS